MAQRALGGCARAGEKRHTTGSCPLASARSGGYDWGRVWRSGLERRRGQAWAGEEGLEAGPGNTERGPSRSHCHGESGGSSGGATPARSVSKRWEPWKALESGVHEDGRTVPGSAPLLRTFSMLRTPPTPTPGFTPPQAWSLKGPALSNPLSDGFFPTPQVGYAEYA